LFFIDVGNGLTVWYFVVFLLELFLQCGILLFFMDVGTVLTLWYFVFFFIGTVPTVWYFVVFHNKIPHCQDSSNRKTTKYHTVWTVPIEKQQNITLSGQFQQP
jgi:hypothetical protein